MPSRSKRISFLRYKVLGLYFIASILGLLVGLFSSLLQLGIKWLTDFLQLIFQLFQKFHIPVLVTSSITSMILVYLAWLMVKYMAPEASGSGVPEIEGALLHKRSIFWRRLLPVKFFGGIMSISAKMVLGREGPTIQIGGNLGEMLGEWFRFSRRSRDTLVASGAAAGLAAAFNAPLAAVLFVLEEMREQFNFSFMNFTTVTIATVCAVIVGNLVMGTSPAIPMSIYQFPKLSQLWYFFPFGIFVGFIGLLFNSSMLFSLFAMDRLTPWQRDGFVLLVGLGVGALAVIHPLAVGGGYEIIEQAVTISPAFNVLVLTFAVRFILTLLCYNTGIPGGFFAPMLAMGTLVGVIASAFFTWLDPSLQPGVFAVAGMGALFAAAVRAPITGILLVVEMTQNYFLILPLMITCLTSTVVMQLAKNKPIYTQLLFRTLRKENNKSLPNDDAI